MGRLITVTKDGSLVEEYDYDINGTRIYEMNTLRSIAGRNFTYSDEDHLLTAGSTSYQYDLDEPEIENTTVSGPYSGTLTSTDDTDYGNNIYSLTREHRVKYPTQLFPLPDDIVSSDAEIIVTPIYTNKWTIQISTDVEYRNPDLLRIRLLVSKSIELFEILSSNIPTYQPPKAPKERIDEIIVVYYKFLKQVYESVAKHYKNRQTQMNNIGLQKTKLSISNKELI